MNENSISTGKVIAGGLWTAVVGLMLGAWFILIFDPAHRPEAFMLGLSACASSALAATFHIRTYMVRACALIRLTTGYEPQTSRPLAPVPSQRV